MLKKINLPLILILLLAVLTRFYQLGDWPQAFAFDEAALGYNAWSLLTTGRDEWGKLLPITMRSFDDFKPAIYSYLAIPGVWLFGLSEFSARLPAAVFGVLLPWFVYLLTARLSKNRYLGYLAALMIVLSPWHMEISRTAIEAGVALSMFCLSLYLFLLKTKRSTWLALALLLLTLFTYHTARIVAPLILLAGFFSGAISAKRSTHWLVGLIFVLGFGLSLTASSSRFNQISIFHDLGSKLKREEAIREDGGIISSSLLETRLFHNKPLSWAQGFVQSYLTNTSLQYLFLGGAQPPRVTIPETGQFLLIFLPFLLIGIAVSVRRWQGFDRWLLIWLLLAPLPAALTYAEIPHSYRTLFMLPPIAILIAQGLVSSFDWLRQQSKLWFLGGVTIVAFGAGYFFSKAVHQYRIHQQVHQPWYRQSGYEQLIEYLNQLENVSHYTITNREGEPYIYVLFYNQIPPRDYQVWPQKRLAHTAIEAGEKEWQLFNYTFSEEPCPMDDKDTDPTHIYVSLPTCELPASYEKLTTIDFLDGNPEFLISRPSDLQL